MKKMWILAAAACLAMGIAGCGEQAKPQGTMVQKVADAPVKQDFQAVTEIKQGQKNIYAVVKAMNGPYWKEIIRGMKEAGEAAHANVYVGGVQKDGDWEVQRDMVHSLENKTVDGVVLGVADSMRMSESAKELRMKKIPVVLVDTALNTQDYDAAYMTNNLAAGVQTAKKMVEMLKAKGVSENDKITVVMHVSNLASRTISERLDSTIANWYNVAPSNWKIDTKYLVNYGDEDTAEKLVYDSLKDIPDLKGIIACNSMSTTETVHALMKLGRKDIAVMGFDMSDITKEGLVDESFPLATVKQNQYKMGYEAVKTAVEAAGGKTVAAKDVDTGITIVDHSNYQAEAGK